MMQSRFRYTSSIATLGAVSLGLVLPIGAAVAAPLAAQPSNPDAQIAAVTRPQIPSSEGAAPSQSAAQNPNPDTAQALVSPEQATAPGDIIVTAQKRAESIQSVPISIVAVSGTELTRSGVNTLNDLQRLAPGLTIAAVGSGFVSYTYIRGGGTNQIDAGSDPSVAFFVDEQYIGGTAGLQFDLFDVDHVEVLKGPQGTLFGRNAASGAISIVTKRPTNTLQADVYGEIGNYDAPFVKGSISGPLTSDGRLLFRTSGFYRYRDPVTQNLNGRGDPGAVNVGGVRGQLEYKGQDVTVLLTADYLKARDGQTNQFLSTANVGGFINPALPLLPGQSFFKHYYNVIGFENQEVYDLTGRIEWQTPIGTITSLSTYRNNIYSRLQDQDGTSYDGLTLESREHDKTFSQELRLVGDAGHHFHYIAGLYYYNADTTDDFAYHAGVDFAAPVLRNTTLVDNSLLKTRSYAAFGQVTYDLTDKLHLTAGGRYTEDKKEDRRAIAYFIGAPFSLDPHNTWRAFTPTVSLDYKINSNILLYGSFRKGFKSGGYQTLGVSNFAAANTPFNPEHVASYEVGVKSSLFDRRVTANIALFRSDITDQQVSSAVSVTSVIITNVGRTRAQGVDFTFQVRPVSGLTLSAVGTYQHARFRRYLSPPNDYSGNTQLRSPDFTIDLGAAYTFDLGSIATVTLSGDYFHSSPVFYELTNARVPGLYQPTYGVGNVQLTIKPKATPIEFGAFVRNVGDKHYYQNLAGTVATGALAVPALPRTYGLTLSYKFGH